VIRRIALATAILTLATAFHLGAFAKAREPQAGARELITTEIDESVRVTLRGNTRPEANRANDRGHVPDDFPLEHMLLQLRRPPELQQEYDAYVVGLTKGGSPSFHQWLTPDQVGENYGLSESDLRHIERWLRQHGIRVNYVYPNRVVMDISTTARELREAMHVDVHFLKVNGENHFANFNDPEIPEALASAIVGIVSIHDFKPHSMFHPMVRPAFTDPNGNYLLGPADLAVIYNLNPLFSQGITGGGQTIALIEDSDPYTPPGMTNTADWNTFTTEFQLTKFGGTVSVTHPNIANNCTDPGVNPDDGEVELDMQWATAAAPGAPLIVATCGTASGVFIAIENIVASSPHPYIMSVSYGECEAALGVAGNAAMLSMFQTAASEGISVFVAAGDQGSASCDAAATPPPGAANGITISGFASTVFNVAVGGTDYGDTFAGTNTTYWSATNGPTLESAVGYVPEIPWNGSCASVLIALGIFGSPVTDGADGGSCGFGFFQTIAAGSGGPSGCATGIPSIANQVSGTCAGYAKPPWQSGLFGNPNDGVRDIPDVSLFAANGFWGHFYVFCYSDPANGGTSCAGTPNPAAGGPWSGAGGTSFASPILAGIQALVNQRTAALTITPTPGQGNPNPVYYAIAKSEYGTSGSSVCNSSTQPLPRRGIATACVFYDVTQGDMDVNCDSGTPNCFGATAPGNFDGVLSTGAISGLTFTAGTGYTSAPTCTITAPHNSSPYNGYAGGVQATCTASVAGGKVTALTLNNAGAGYAPNPICTLTGGGGTGATCSVSGITATSYQPAFPTTPGWDFATGIGTINAYNLVYSTVWAEGP
jgi:subtilase family serine protease